MTVADVKRKIEHALSVPIQEQVLLCGVEELDDNDHVDCERISPTDCLDLLLLEQPRPFSGIDALVGRLNPSLDSKEYDYAQVWNDMEKVTQVCAGCGEFDASLVEALLNRVVKVVRVDRSDGTVQCRVMRNMENPAWDHLVWLPAAALCPASLAALCRAGLLEKVAEFHARHSMTNVAAASAAAYWWLLVDGFDRDADRQMSTWEMIGNSCRHASWESLLDARAVQLASATNDNFFRWVLNALLPQLDVLLRALSHELPCGDEWASAILTAWIWHQSREPVGKAHEPEEHCLLKKEIIQRRLTLRSLWQLHPLSNVLLRDKIDELLENIQQTPLPWDTPTTIEMIQNLRYAVWNKVELPLHIVVLLAKAWETQDPWFRREMRALGTACSSWEFSMMVHAHAKSANLVATLRSQTGNLEKELLNIVGNWVGDLDAVNARLAPVWMQEAARDALGNIDIRSELLNVYTWQDKDFRQTCLARIFFSLEDCDITDEVAHLVAEIVYKLEGYASTGEVSSWEEIGSLHGDWKLIKDEMQLMKDPRALAP